jgi:hypothetical protein
MIYYNMPDEVWKKVDESLGKDEVIPFTAVDQWIAEEYGMYFEGILVGGKYGKSYCCYEVTDIKKLTIFLLKWS